MKLAYFSPMPPARTGIAQYARQLAIALNDVCELTIFTPTPEAEPVPELRMVDFASDPHVLKMLCRYDHRFFHIGNNPWFHGEILKAMTLFPGAACLHDLVLYYLIAGMGRGALLRELLLADAPSAFRDLASIESGSPDGDLLRYPTASRHPSMRSVLRLAPQLIVHNRTTAAALRAAGYAGRIDVVPLLHYAGEFPAASPQQVRATRTSLGYSDEDIVFGAFGFIGPPKRLDKVLEAFASLPERIGGRNPRLLVVGEGESIDARVATLGIGSRVRHEGFVADERFRGYLSSIDVLVNLRYPSHGESSATLIQAMSYGKPCIVTDYGSFAELPGDTVLKIGFGTNEVGELAAAMRALAEDPALGCGLGERAREHVLHEHAPERAARSVAAALQASLRESQASAHEAPAPFEPARYLQERAREIAPP